MIFMDWKDLQGFDPVCYKVVSTFMEGRDVAALSPGRYELESGIYVNVDCYETRKNHRYEAHKKFVDIQVMVAGEEEMFCAPMTHGTPLTGYDPEKDVWFFDCDRGPFCTVHLKAGMAVVLEPWDLHAPCNWATKRQNQKLVFKLPVELVQKTQVKTVACCGDSITFGLLATSPEWSYPSVLQGLLGDGYRVENYGRNGATVIADYPLLPNRYAPYLKSPEYAMAMVSSPDIVILMLGMNDGNPTHHFNTENGGPMSEEYRKQYEDTLTELVENFRGLPSKPQVYLAQTTAMRRVVGPAFDAAYIKNFTENTKLIRQLQTKLAEKLSVPFIDTLADMDDGAYYRDGCHLTDAGYGRLAHVMHKALREEQK